MFGEDLGVFEQQVLALHAGAARLGANQQGLLGILEGHQRVAGADHVSQQREGAVFEFHHHTGECGLGFFQRQFEHLQDDRLVFAQHFATGDAEQQGVTDLSSGTGDCDSNGGFGHDEELLEVR